jgi:hypothetical protein
MPVIASIQKIHVTAGTSGTPTSTRTLLATLSTAAAIQKQQGCFLHQKDVRNCGNASNEKGGKQHISILAKYEKC